MRLFIFLKSLIIILLFTCSFEKNPLSISSNEASFNDNIFNLQDEVKISHELGTIKAKKASFELSDNKISKVFLKEEVIVSLKRGGELTCDEATLDYKNMQVTLQSKVVYEGPFIKKDKNKIRISSKKVLLDTESKDNIKKKGT